jgi:hypothetical protein
MSAVLTHPEMTPQRLDCLADDAVGFEPTGAKALLDCRVRKQPRELVHAARDHARRVSNFEAIILQVWLHHLASLAQGDGRKQARNERLA